MSLTHTCYICTVCNKRWGIESEGSDVELSRCEKHTKTMTSREYAAAGGKYITHAERMEKIKASRIY